MKLFILRLFTAVAAFVLGTGVAGVFRDTPSADDVPASSSILVLNPGNVAPCSGSGIDFGDESYAVYSAVLNADEFSGETLMVNDTTQGFQSLTPFEVIPKAFPGDRGELAASFTEANRTPQKLSDKFERGRVTLTGYSDQREINGPEDQYWDRFADRYRLATGILTFSAVGFDASRQGALVYAVFNCGPKCGRGKFFALQKGLNGWVIVADKTIWVS